MINHLQSNSVRAFSLIELLVALSILAVVAAIIVPRFLNVRGSASITAATSQIKELKQVYQNFLALGGTGSTNAGDVVLFLNTQATAAGTARTARGTVTDSAGNMGSTTISFGGGTVNTVTAAPTASSAGPAFYAISGSGAYYVDGTGNMWTINTTTTDLSATHTTVATGATATNVN